MQMTKATIFFVFFSLVLTTVSGCYLYSQSNSYGMQGGVQKERSEKDLYKLYRCYQKIYSAVNIKMGKLTRIIRMKTEIERYKFRGVKYDTLSTLKNYKLTYIDPSEVDRLVAECEQKY